MNSLPHSRTITDWTLFSEVIAGICALEGVRAVAITGGEPFAEPRGLSLAVRRLHAAGKAVVLFTSGHWARQPHRGRPTGTSDRDPAPLRADRAVPAWIASVLALTSAVYLSTDSFHTAALGATVAPAVRAIEAAGCHLILQVLDEPGAVRAARALSRDAELAVVRPLSTGRGAALSPPPVPRPADTFGRCALLASPTVRYDGTVTACCNEAVITGAGPAALRRRATRWDEVGQALADLRADPVLRLMGAYGPVALRAVADGVFRTICEPCWAAHEAVAAHPRNAALLAVLGGRS